MKLPIAEVIGKNPKFLAWEKALRITETSHEKY